MVWVCTECERNNHKNCKTRWTCDCKCNVNRSEDITQKAAAITAGVGMVIGGIALSIFTGGIGAILLGGALVGGGVSSTVNGTVKAVKKERMCGKSYAFDVGFGVITGVATGGVGAVGEVAATAAAKQVVAEGVKTGATKLVVRAAAGATAGTVTKVIDEVKQCSVSDKQWKDFGKSFDADGKENGTAAAWLVSAGVGSLGGASSHLSSNVTKSISSGIGKSVTRIGVSAATATAGDAAAQGVNIAAGNQENYDFKRTITCASTSALLTTAQEGTKSAIYRLHGGKDSMLNQKANEKAIRKTVPKESRESVMTKAENLKKISQERLINEENQAAAYTQSSERADQHNSNQKIIDEKIQREIKLKDEAIAAKKVVDINRHKSTINALKQQKMQQTQDFKSVAPLAKKSAINFMNDDNAHFLTGKNSKQIAVDVKSIETAARGPVRATFDVGITNDGRSEFRYAGYTNDHNYESLPVYGKSDYYKFHQQYKNELNAVNGKVNQLASHQSLQCDENNKKGKKKD